MDLKHLETQLEENRKESTGLKQRIGQPETLLEALKGIANNQKKNNDLSKKKPTEHQLLSTEDKSKWDRNLPVPSINQKEIKAQSEKQIMVAGLETLIKEKCMIPLDDLHDFNKKSEYPKNHKESTINMTKKINANHSISKRLTLSTKTAAVKRKEAFPIPLSKRPKYKKLYNIDEVHPFPRLKESVATEKLVIFTKTQKECELFKKELNKNNQENTLNNTHQDEPTCKSTVNTIIDVNKSFSENKCMKKRLCLKSPCYNLCDDKIRFSAHQFNDLTLNNFKQQKKCKSSSSTLKIPKTTTASSSKLVDKIKIQYKTSFCSAGKAFVPKETVAPEILNSSTRKSYNLPDNSKFYDNDHYAAPIFEKNLQSCGDRYHNLQLLLNKSQDKNIPSGTEILISNGLNTSNTKISFDNKKSSKIEKLILDSDNSSNTGEDRLDTEKFGSEKNILLNLKYSTANGNNSLNVKDQIVDRDNSFNKADSIADKSCFTDQGKSSYVEIPIEDEKNSNTAESVKDVDNLSNIEESNADDNSCYDVDEDSALLEKLLEESEQDTLNVVKKNNDDLSINSKNKLNNSGTLLVKKSQCCESDILVERNLDEQNNSNKQFPSLLIAPIRKGERTKPKPPKAKSKVNSLFDSRLYNTFDSNSRTNKLNATSTRAADLIEKMNRYQALVRTPTTLPKKSALSQTNDCSTPLNSSLKESEILKKFKSTLLKNKLFSKPSINGSWKTNKNNKGGTKMLNQNTDSLTVSSTSSKQLDTNQFSAHKCLHDSGFNSMKNTNFTMSALGSTCSSNSSSIQNCFSEYDVHEANLSTSHYKLQNNNGLISEGISNFCKSNQNSDSRGNVNILSMPIYKHFEVLATSVPNSKVESTTKKGKLVSYKTSINSNLLSISNSTDDVAQRNMSMPSFGNLELPNGLKSKSESKSSNQLLVEKTKIPTQLPDSNNKDAVDNNDLEIRSDSDSLFDDDFMEEFVNSVDEEISTEAGVPSSAITDPSEGYLSNGETHPNKAGASNLINEDLSPGIEVQSSTIPNASKNHLLNGEITSCLNKTQTPMNSRNQEVSTEVTIQPPAMPGVFESCLLNGGITSLLNNPELICQEPLKSRAEISGPMENMNTLQQKDSILHLKCKPLKVVIEDCCKPRTKNTTNVTVQHDLEEVNNIATSFKTCSGLPKCKPLKIVLEDCLKQKTRITVEAATPNTCDPIFKNKTVSCVKSFSQASLCDSKTKTDNDSVFKNVMTAETKNPSKDVISKNITAARIKTFGCRKKSTLLIKKKKRKNFLSKTGDEDCEKLLCIPFPLSEIFSKLERSVLTRENFDFFSQMLLGKLTDKKFIAGGNEIIYYVLKFLSLMNKNPILFFKEIRDLSLFLPPVERCVVSVLSQINSKLLYEGILSSVTVNISQLLLGMNSLTLKGCCALSRVYTQICKANGNKMEPLTLCSNLLKIIHKFSPMIIACIAGVWPDLFEVPCDVSDEEAIFHSAIALGSKKCLKSQSDLRSGLQMTDSELEISSFVLGEFMSASPLEPTAETIDALINAVIQSCIEGSRSGEYFLTSSIVIIAAHKGGEWAKQNIVEKHLLPKIEFYSVTEPNEEALSLFCNLYAEICFFYPEKSHPEDILFQLFDNNNHENEFLQDCAAPALIQLLLSRNNLLPDSIRKWLERRSNDPKFAPLKLVCHRALLAKKVDFLKDDML